MFGRRVWTGILLNALLPVAAQAEVPSFSRQIVPTFYKLGCSSGRCHGSFSGQGSFQLSLFASDPALDYANLRGGMGRRINLVDVEQSLLLAKPSGRVPHGGGLRLKPDSEAYRLLRDWVAAGAPLDPPDAPTLVSLRAEPAALTLAVNAQATVRVLATFSDQSEQDVTPFTTFDPRDPGTASADATGVVTALAGGDTSVLAHYAGHIAFATVAVPTPLPPGIERPQENYADALDAMVAGKLKRLAIVPAPVCDDYEFIRRVYLDTTSTLPTPEQVRTFVANPAADKRARLIDELLAHPLHSAQWATKLCDLLGADNRFMNSTAWHDWLRHKFENNVAWDQIAFGIFCANAAAAGTPEEATALLQRVAEETKRQKEIEAAKKAGTAVPDAGPAVAPWRTGLPTWRTLPDFYSALKYQKQIRDAEGKDVARIVDGRAIGLQLANAFLGVQLSCAQCHKHPHDRWSQADFLGFSATFSYVRVYGPDPALMAQKVTVQGVHVEDQPAEPFMNPATFEPLLPRALAGQPIEVKVGVDPRHAVWQWLSAADNPYFARAFANRVWAQYLGRGLFEPIDSQASANPPSHPDVLEELARSFIAGKFNVRELERRVLNTVAYQRSWRTNASNARDDRNFSRRILRRLTAEQTLEAITQVTGIAPKLTKVYSGDLRPGERVIEMSLSRFRGDDWYALNVFGKPLRVTSCECERGQSTSLSQSLYLYNDETLQAKLSDPTGSLKKLVEEITEDERLVNELYLLVLTRLPTADEIMQSQRFLQSVPSRLEAYEDLVWSLLNRPEFIVNH